MPDEQRRPAADPAPVAALAPAELRRLAEKVYRLMLADARLERARAGSAARREARP